MKDDISSLGVHDLHIRLINSFCAHCSFFLQAIVHDLYKEMTLNFESSEL